MSTRNDRWLDHTGLNLIRIVIGSYFMAISLGLVSGLEPAGLLRPLLPARIAELAGTLTLFMLAAAFMAGILLRFFALTLALFVFCSSLVGNSPLLGAGVVAPFWRDLALVCAVLLTYAPLGRRELRRAALILRRSRVRGRRRPGPVRPQRVTAQQGPASRHRSAGVGLESSMRPTIAPIGPIPPLPPVSRTNRAAPDDANAVAADDDEIENLFVNLR